MKKSPGSLAFNTLFFLFVFYISSFSSIGYANSDNYEEKRNSFFTIASGDINGIYFAFVGELATILSSPIDSLPCGKGGTCGMKNTQIINLTTSGSIDNLAKLKSKRVDAAITQSDIAYFAYNGLGEYKNNNYRELRVISSLYPEYLHILARKSANINSIKDLKGKRVSIGSKGSGSYFNAKSVLSAYKLTEKNMDVSYLNTTAAMEKLSNKTLDAIFYSVGSSTTALSFLYSKNKIDNHYKLLSLDPYEQSIILKTNKYFSPAKIDYKEYGLNEVNTVSLFALLVTDSRTDDDLIFKFTESLWSDASQLFLRQHPVIDLDLDAALDGVSIPLHEGAKKYYNSIGKRF